MATLRRISTFLALFSALAACSLLLLSEKQLGTYATPADNGEVVDGPPAPAPPNPNPPPAAGGRGRGAGTYNQPPELGAPGRGRGGVGGVGGRSRAPNLYQSGGIGGAQDGRGGRARGRGGQGEGGARPIK